MSALPDSAPSPRLCHILQWPDFQGYGFNLHAEKSKPGQFIGKIDNDSPAEVAGLKEGDRIIEVNGVNIGNENHKQVVSRIKAVSKETKLLVVDLETDQWYKGKNIVVRGDQTNIIYGSSNRDAAPPPPPEIATNGHHEEADTRSVSSHASSSAASEASTQPQPVAPVEEISDAPAVPEKEVAPPASDPPTEEAQSVVEEDNSSVEEEAGALVVEDKEVVQVSNEIEKTSIVGDGSLSDLEAEYDNVNIIAQTSAAAVANEVTSESAYDTAAPGESAPVEGLPINEASGEVVVPLAVSSRRSSVTSSTSSVSATSAASRSSRGSAHIETTQSPMSTSPTPPPSLDTTSTKTPEPIAMPTSTPEPVPNTTTTLNSATHTEKQQQQQPLANRNSFNASGLNLNMSAAEMRAHLASRKKTDPRKETIDLKKKYEIIQNM